MTQQTYEYVAEGFSLEIRVRKKKRLHFYLYQDDYCGDGKTNTLRHTFEIVLFTVIDTLCSLRFGHAFKANHFSPLVRLPSRKCSCLNKLGDIFYLSNLESVITFLKPLK